MGAMNRDRSYLAYQREFFERMAREDPGFRGGYWESKRRENEALMEAVKLEDAFVEGKNCTTQKQREAARREYRKHQRTFARQREAKQLLKV